jgi:hypothetical protein
MPIETHEIKGVIFPIRRINYNILKKRNNPIFIKFLTHSDSKNPTKLQSDHFLLLYLSKSNKSIIAYSQIKRITFKKPLEVLKYHLDDIQMEKEEFSKYIQNRENKSLVLLELKKISELDNPVPVDQPITMAGMYVSKNSFDTLKKRISINLDI